MTDPVPNFQLSLPFLISANVRGMNTDAFRILRRMRHSRAKIICLQETKINHTSSHFLSNLWKGPSLWGSGDKPAEGTAILFSQDLEPVTDRAILHPRRIIVPFLWKNKEHLLVNLYAPNTLQDRQTFFQETLHVLISSDLLESNPTIIVAGDFNTIIDTALDKMGGDPNQRTPPSSLTLLEETLSLSDSFRYLYPQKKDTTWSNGHIFTRIDRILISTSALSRVQKVFHNPTPYSDHKEVVLHFDSPNPLPLFSPSKAIPTPVLRDHTFIREIAKIHSESLSQPDPNEWFESITKKASEMSKNILVTKKEENHSVLSTISRRIRMLESSLSKSWNPQLLEDLKLEKKKFHKEANRKDELHENDAKIKFLLEGEKCSRYFSQFVKKPHSPTQVEALKDSQGRTTKDPTQLPNIASNFFQTLLSHHPNPSIEDQEILLSNVKKKLSVSQSTILDNPISEKEIEEALKSLPNGKTPGPDGIPVEFWKTFKTMIPSLKDLFQYWYDNNAIPDHVQEGTITLIFKKGDPTLLGNYRPISLLNSVLKILTKILTKRLQKVITTITSPLQTAAPGRHIGSNIRTIQDIIAYSKIEHRSLALLLLDQEKAFDKCDWLFLKKTLKEMGFGDTFLKWINLLYDNPTSRVRINGILSEPFPLRRGTRQGDPLSPLLYIIYLEPFLSSLENDPLFRGASLPDGSTIPFVAYADDCTILGRDLQDIQRVEYWMSTFTTATGSTFNLNKCELILLNIRPPPISSFTTITEFHQPFKILGCEFNLDLDPMITLNGPIQKFENTLTLWKKSSLSLTGKVVVVKSYALPILNFQAAVVPIPPSIVERIEKLIWNFLWDPNKAKVNKETCNLPKSQGGLGLPRAATLFASLQAKWISRLLSPSPTEPWKILAQWAISGVREWASLGLFNLISPGHHNTAINAKTLFWGYALKAFWNCNPILKINPNWTSNEMGSFPLFLNPLITHKGETLSSSRWRLWTKSGFNFLKDLIPGGDPIPLAAIQARYPHLSKRSYHDLLGAIPETLMQIMKTQGPNSEMSWHQSVCFDNLPAHKAETRDLRPPPPHQIPKHQGTWDALTSIPLNWKRIHKELWSAQIPRKWKDHGWLILRRSLFLGDKAASIGWNEIPHCCMSCDDSLETLHHLYLYCPRATRCWELSLKIAHSWNPQIQLISPHSPCFLSALGLQQMDHLLSKLQRKAWIVLFLATVQAIWKARCLEVFGGLDPYPPRASLILQASIRSHANTLRKINKPLASLITQSL